VTAGVALAIGAYATFKPDDGRQPGDPCRGLSDAECYELITKKREDFDSRFEAWIADFNKSGVDLRSLETSTLNVAYGPLETSLDSAVKRADAIVIGRSKEITFDTQWGYTTLAVDETLKGGPFSETTIAQPGGPRPYPDWDSMILGVSELDPLIFPGDKVLFFLTYAEELQKFEVQPGTGFYRIDEVGNVNALEANPFAASVNGKSSSEFVSEIETLAASD
jgi:hypothetical protein